MAIKTYEEVMGKTSTQKSGIITYESLFGKKEEPVEKPGKQGLFSTPSNLSPERKAAYDRGFFPKPINNLLANLSQRYEDSKLGKFNARASETALDVMSAQEIKPDRTSTGSSVGDAAATVLGSLGGFVISPNKGTSIGSALTKAGQPAEFAARKLLTKAPAALPKIATKAAPVIARGATEGAAYGFGTGIAQGKSTGEAVKQAGTDALFGVALDPLIVLGIPALGSKLLSGTQKAISKFKGVKVDTDTIAKDVAKDIGVDWAYMNESQRAAIRRVVQNMQPEPVRSGRLLPSVKGEGQGFFMRDMTPIPEVSLNKSTPPPLNFKQTIEVPKVYDKHAFTGETRPLSKLDQLMMKENAGTNQVMAKQVSKIDQPAKIETVEEILRTIMPGKLKDISGPQSYFTDAYRNFHKVFGKDYDRVKRAVLDPFDKAKGENARFQESWLNKLQTEIVSDKTGLGIKKGSKLSALVQKYGEGTITEAELSSLTEAELNKIKTADAWFRKAYDELLDRVNLVRRQIYPTNPDKIIPKRQDYYRHFKEITNDIQGLKNIFDTPAQIDPKLEGISEYTKPKTAWKSWAQRRFGGMDYTNDAVGGFLGYLPSASYGIHIDPHISKFSGLAKQMAEKTGATKDTNNFIRFLNQYSQDLAGKTNPLDRRIQEMVGRGAFRAVSWLNSRVKANVILGNLGSSLAQLGNIPQGIGHAKQHSLNGFLRTIRSLYEPNKAIAQSDFIKERFLDKLYRQFDTDLLSKPRNLAVWLMESMDKAGTHFIWNSAHEKAIKEGIKNPIKYADDVARDMVAGRGIGEVPIGQKSKMIQTLIPFTLEVSNLWKVQKDMLNKKDMVGLLLLYASCFGFNEAMEKIRGSRVTFDPIDALREAITDDELTGFQRAGRVVGEVISNVPGGQFAAQLYPEYGAQIGDAKLPSRRELFGSNDPSRYGPGMISVKGLQDPLTHVLTPFGGMQISKTLKGVDALRNRGVYTEKPTLLTYGQELLTGEPQPRTKLKYPVDTDLKNTAGGLMFGIGGLKETRPYYDNNRRPLSENQTKDLKRQEAKGRNVKALYEAKMAERRIDTLETKLKEVNKLNLTTEEKALERARLRQEIKKYKELRNQFLQKK